MVARRKQKRAKERNGTDSCIQSLSPIAGEGAERSEAGEGASFETLTRRRAVPSATLSRNAGEGLISNLA